MIKILFMGTPKFSVPILDALANDERYEIVGVVTQPDKIGGRGHNLIMSPVKEYAIEKNFKIFQPEHIKDQYDELINLGADIIITAAYGQFVGTRLLDSPRFKAINCHGSLLPKYRGGSPIQTAIKNGDKETGITIMYMIKEMDAGDIIAQRSIPIEDSDTNGTLFDKLSYLARDLLMDTLPLIIEGKINPIKQDESLVTFAYNIKKEEELIDFNLDARSIFNQIRAFNPEPTAYMKLKDDEIKVYESIVLDETSDLKPGSILLNQKGHLKMVCGNKTVLEILSLKPAGKKLMTGRDFLNGHVNKYL